MQLGSSCQLERSDRLEKAISESVDKLGTKWHSFSAEADGVNDLDLLQHGIDFLVAETNTDEFKSILLESSCNHQSTSGKTVAYIIKSLGFKVQTKFPEDFDYRQAALDMVAVFATWTWESAEDATKCLSYCSLSLCSPPFFPINRLYWIHVWFVPSMRIVVLHFCTLLQPLAVALQVTSKSRRQ